MLDSVADEARDIVEMDELRCVTAVLAAEDDRCGEATLRYARRIAAHDGCHPHQKDVDTRCGHAVFRAVRVWPIRHRRRHHNQSAYPSALHGIEHRTDFGDCGLAWRGLRQTHHCVSGHASVRRHPCGRLGSGLLVARHAVHPMATARQLRADAQSVVSADHNIHQLRPASPFPRTRESQLT
jgi:hypothetical protein